MKGRAKMNILITYVNVKRVLCTKDCLIGVNTKEHTWPPRTNERFRKEARSNKPKAKSNL